MSTPSQRNRDPILNVLREVIPPGKHRLLEIGSGSAEHADYFSSEFKEMHWFMSDREENVPYLKHVQEKLNKTNLHGPIQLEIGKDNFPKQSKEKNFDIVFTANTLHIMSWKEVKALIKLFGKHLSLNSTVIIYGPFNYDGKFTSDSNESFDGWLKDRNPKSGIRNFEDIESNMNKVGFKLLKDFEMPANNRTLVFHKDKVIKG